AQMQSPEGAARRPARAGAKGISALHRPPYENWSLRSSPRGLSLSQLPTSNYQQPTTPKSQFSHNAATCLCDTKNFTMPRRLRVKFILPALTEATSPFWRPIKYSLFPPLGLATLAAYLRDDDEAVIVDEHVERVDTDDCPDLVVIQVYITNARRAYALADAYHRKGVFVAPGGLPVTALPDEAAAAP